MRRIFFLVTLAVLVLAFITALEELARATPSPAPENSLGAGTRLLSPIQFHQLAVFPVVQKTGGVDPKYLTLSEGVQKKLVKVSEEGPGGSVNRVRVANASDRPLLLLGGEVILGGQQDRILGKDAMIPAHENMTVEVFCVEHGRWSGNREFSAANGFADGKIRVRAKYKSDQSAVWAEVAKRNGQAAANPSTGTYRNLAVGSEGDKAKKPYRERLSSELGKLPEGKQLVGLVVALNGRVTSVDVFASPSLFAAYRDKLVESIAMSAVDVKEVPAAKPATAADVDRFVTNADSAAPKEIMKTHSARTVEKSGKGVLNSTVEGNDQKPIYKSYQLDE